MEWSLCEISDSGRVSWRVELIVSVSSTSSFWGFRSVEKKRGVEVSVERGERRCE